MSITLTMVSPTAVATTIPCHTGGGAAGGAGGDGGGGGLGCGASGGGGGEGAAMVPHCMLAIAEVTGVPKLTLAIWGVIRSAPRAA